MATAKEWQESAEALGAVFERYEELAPYWTSVEDCYELFRTLSLIAVGCYSCDTEIDDVGVCVVPRRISYINHSCEPNAMFIFYPNNEVRVRAIRDIEEGEPVLFTYVTGDHTTRERRDHLRDTYGFECGCERCAAPPEDEEEFVKAFRAAKDVLFDHCEAGEWPEAIEHAETYVRTSKAIGGMGMLQLGIAELTLGQAMQEDARPTSETAAVLRDAVRTLDVGVGREHPMAQDAVETLLSVQAYHRTNEVHSLPPLVDTADGGDENGSSKPGGGDENVPP